MKKTKFMLGIIVVCCVFAVYADNDVTVSNSPSKSVYEKEVKKLPGRGEIFPFGIFRGTFSLIQAPAEPMRGVVLLATPRGTGGWLTLPITLPLGLFVGTFYTVFRTAISTVDIISFGSVDVYNDVCPPFIWDSSWTTKATKQKMQRIIEEN